MKISSCPICGRTPIIEECRSFKDGISRRLCHCPQYCGVIPKRDRLFHSSFIYCGEGDSNAIYKVWNHAIEMYLRVKDEHWWPKDETFWREEELSHRDKWWDS